jgi:hypothetical protein
MNGIALSDAQQMTPQMWVLVALGMMTILYAVFLRPMRRQKKDPLARPIGQGPGSLARQRDVERQMETLLVELAGMARQITGQLDTRAARLQELIRQADAAIARLNGAPRREAGAAEMAEAESEEDQRHAAVYQLADSGMDCGQIAQRLERPSGEIELILALRARR